MMTVSVYTWCVVITRLPQHVMDIIYMADFFPQKDFEHLFDFIKSTLVSLKLFVFTVESLGKALPPHQLKQGKKIVCNHTEPRCE